MPFSALRRALSAISAGAWKEQIRSALITFNLTAAVWFLPMTMYLLGERQYFADGKDLAERLAAQLGHSFAVFF
ncbi:hypothetical protein QNO08_07510 [Arthrobacter sp. zg-Y820]|uniref:hypothetical protein n=1 Tax=unclassified Arthrobacter TaxID=235627 RepID=UPI001E43D993|nr:MULTISPECIES: hypothetical protein [unclassified Arthrobacter]MCC9197634.1 hypothetical protein [Arthrobacter sp. zg-Y820]MDK1280501.1 hypothetical protein [Arthrobacter sp. zg.Y820]WIB10860.1 hypothetical protein QNO08_07510 [Arthrobacter sp. zg-Y820]